jgi:DNA-binding NarL/FixJ family response regulator
MPYPSDAPRCSYPFATPEALDQLLALLGEAVVVVQADDQVVYRSPAAAEQLDGRNGRLVLGDVLVAARRALAGGKAADGSGCVSGYGGLRARRLEPGGAGGAVAVVALARPAADLPAAEEVMWRFGLTAREASVARLLAEGRGNASVARALGIRTTTARHYTEAVLLKLGVRSRAAVAATLLGARAADAPLPPAVLARAGGAVS